MSLILEGCRRFRCLCWERANRLEYSLVYGEDRRNNLCWRGFGLASGEEHGVDAVDSVCEEHPGYQRTKKAEDDAVGGA
jgi:hypothetical protein